MNYLELNSKLGYLIIILSLASSSFVLGMIYEKFNINQDPYEFFTSERKIEINKFIDNPVNNQLLHLPLFTPLQTCLLIAIYLDGLVLS